MFNLLKKSTNHEHYGMMTPHTKNWWKENLQYVALQIFDTQGNVVLFCNNGRSRGPMYLVAYLVIVHCLTPMQAMDSVRELLHEQRGCEMDRFDSLVPFIYHIFDSNQHFIA